MQETSPSSDGPDIDLEKMEKTAERYSGPAILQKMESVLSWRGVNDEIYGGLYSSKVHGHISFESGSGEKGMLLEKLTALSLEDRMEIASIIGTLKFDVELEMKKDISERDLFGLTSRAGEEIRKIIFREFYTK